MSAISPASPLAERRRLGAALAIAAAIVLAAGCNGKGLMESNTGGTFRQLNLNTGTLSVPQRYITPTPSSQIIFREIPAQTGKTNSFFISVFEITQSQWKNLAGGNGPWPWELVTPADEVGGTDYVADKPMFGATFLEVETELMGYNHGKSIRLRLPTANEWERACDAGSSGIFSWGNSRDLSKVKKYAVVRETRTGYGAHIVGERLPNDFGIFDMHGNVWEWTSDGDIHGGSWKDNLYSARTNNDTTMHDEIPHGLVGLRLVLEP